MCVGIYVYKRINNYIHVYLHSSPVYIAMYSHPWDTGTGTEMPWWSAIPAELFATTAPPAQGCSWQGHGRKDLEI